MLLLVLTSNTHWFVPWMQQSTQQHYPIRKRTYHSEPDKN